MRKVALLWLLLWGTITLHAEYSYQKGSVTIVRDTFGIPHIYGKTDADAAYGLAWAHSEDAFALIQHNLLATKNKAGTVLGKKGVIFDFASLFFGVDTLVENRYEKDISADFKKVLEGYAQGINDYAKHHPDEVLADNTFPYSPQDIVKGYVTLGILLAGAGLDIKALRDNVADVVFEPNDKGSGSNTMAIAASRTEDGKTWLLNNSHQPIEGSMAWYEAHINSEQGWNAMGGLFPGGVSVFVGCNERLGWAHTTDYHNFGDVYQLTLSRNKKKYFFENEWHDFSYKTVRLKIRLGAVVLPVKRKIPQSVFGPVFKTKHGWYALRYPSAMDIRGAEQWFRMNKATGLAEFEAILQMNALPLFNVMYADTAGNILFVSDGRIPLRDTALDWSRPIKEPTRAHIWKDILPYERKIKYKNPAAGYLFNANGTPLQATAENENSKEYFVGLQLFTYNRNERYARLLGEHSGTFKWEDFLRIKFDVSYDTAGTYMRNFSRLYGLDAARYPKLKEQIEALKNWNLRGVHSDTNATVAMLTHKFLMKGKSMPFAIMMIQKDPVPESDIVQALTQTKKYLLKHYKTTCVPLGDVQKIVRGDKSFPIDGLSEVSRAVDTKYDKQKGIYKMTAGDGFMQFLRFSPTGVEIESISPFGASAHPESKHYTSQMELFVQKKTKKMSLDKHDVWKSAERIYEPGK